MTTGEPASIATLLDDLDQAHDVFAGLVANVSAADLALPTVNDGWTVRDVVNHVVDGDFWAVTYLRTGADEFTDTDYVGNETAAAAVAQGRRALAVILRDRSLPERDLPLSAIVTIRIDELVGHGWDIAQATGQDTDIAPRLAAQSLERVRIQLDDPEFRAEFYKPPQPVAPDAPVADRLAAFCGKPVGNP